MMISEAMNARLNRQVSMEFAASHKYLAMACAFDAMGFKILSKRFRLQADEERDHAMKILDYVLEVNGRADLEQVPKPSGKYESVEQIVKTALESELEVTRSINEIVAQAESEKDFATRSFLHWFVDEQVEEVASMTELLDLVKLAGPNILLVETRVFHQMQAGK
ncbi:MAG: ferritin [Phycisphaerae bacterium]|nr:ferritin [Phycisphaerae bacterium]